MIEHYLQLINNYLAAKPYMGQLIAFVIALAESLPIIGTIIPGSVTMTAIGILAGRNIIPIYPTLFFAFLGAFTGDAIGFWIGKKYNEKLRLIWPFRKHPKWLTLGEAFFKKHGGKSILIGRFVGPVRSSVPLIAGLLKMQWIRFMFAAIPSAILWAIAYTLPGILVGAISLQLPKGKTTAFTLIGLGIIILLWLIFWAIQRFFVLIVNYLNGVIDQTWYWLNHHHSSKFVIRLIKNQTHPRDHRQLALLILASISLILFFIVFLCVYLKVGIYDLNYPLFHLIQSVRSHRADRFFVIISQLGQWNIITRAGFLITIGLLLKKQWRAAAHLFTIIIVSGLITGFIKHIYFSPRPQDFMHIIPTSSFPSGHSVLSLTILGFLAFLTNYNIHKKFHWITYLFASIIITLIVYSRLYLGAHWISDVMGGIFLGFTILLTTIVAFRRRAIFSFNHLTWFGLLSLCIAIPWISLGIYFFPKQIYNYTPYFQERRVQINDWWQDPTEYLPLYRLDRLGQPIQAFNVQWADTLGHITRTLKQHNWDVIHHRNTIKYTIDRFASYNPERHLPVFSELYRNHSPILFMIHKISNQKIIELRLWKTGIQFFDSNLPLWIGSINYHYAPHKLIRIKNLLEISYANKGGIYTLQAALPKSYNQSKIITATIETMPEKLITLHWDGSIIIIRRK